MTEERLAELERLEQAATPGPWDCITQPERDCLISTEKPDADGRHHSIVFAPHGKGWDAIEWGIKARNVQCIVAARNALPELLAEVRRLRACREALRLCLAEYVEEYGSASCDCEEPGCWVCKSVEALKATE